MKEFKDTIQKYLQERAAAYSCLACKPGEGLFYSDV